MTHQSITTDLVRSALAHVPPDLPRDDWAKVCMAIKSEFPNEDGFRLFDDWSQGAGERYSSKDAHSTWRSVKAGGGVAIGTLLHMAKENGFVVKASAGSTAPDFDPTALARRSLELKERQQREQEQLASGHATAARRAELEWGAATEDGASPYLQRKGVQGFGVRYGQDGKLLVPLRDDQGRLWNLQTIAPREPAEGSDKRFLPRGRKSGLWHMLGSVEPNGVILLAEGYATAASLHEATGHPTACAFDAGNLVHVAKALRKRFPQARIVVCGDDDRGTESSSGKNPGRLAAAKAARAVSGLMAFPPDLKSGESDFNDLHQRAGLVAVRAAIEAVTKRFDQVEEEAALDSRGFDRFSVDDEAVWYHPPENDAGGGGGRRRVCGPLRVIALARDAQDVGAALLLEFDTPFSKARRWLMPLTMLAGDGTAYRSALFDQGFVCPSDTSRRRWLTEYLQTRQPRELVRHVSRVGWHGRCYVLPRETLGDCAGDRLIFHSEAGIEANFAQRGTLEQWQQAIARLAVDNSRIAFAISVALAGPLLAWVPGVGGGGIHYVGETSTGKTTGLLAAASVWGKGVENDQTSYLQKWRATGNGLEYLGEQHSDCTLILDELGQMEPSEAGVAAYMLADGMGKARAKAGGGLRHKPTWRLLFLSSGELTLAQHMETVGKRMKGGQEVRLIPIPAAVAPGSTMETHHEFESGHEMSSWIKQHAARIYGVAGRAWLEWLAAHTEALTGPLRVEVERIEAELVPESSSGQVKRGGRRFALIAAAGELATEAGITGWSTGEATRAARACFNAWIQARGGTGSSEVAAMVRQVRQFLEAHGEGRFKWWHRGADDHDAKTLHRAGYRRMLDAEGRPIKSNSEHQREFGERMQAGMGGEVQTEYFVLAEVFKAEVCKGYDYRAVARVLKDLECLIGEDDERFTYKARLPGVGHASCFRITPKIFEVDL